MTSSRSHALVLGASMAGLAAAASLASRFDRVTVVERDQLPEGAAQRRGVPQGRHVHSLLAGGLLALERSLPGLTDDLTAAGAVTLDVSRHLRAFSDGGWLRPPATSDQTFVAASRPLLEAAVRHRCLALPNVVLRTGCDARGLATDGAGAVTGVRLLPRRAGSSEEIAAADLVVDASGRASRTPRWLEDLGYAAPHLERVDVGVRYATRLFRRRPTDLGGHLELFVGAIPSGRGADAQAIEGDRWIVTLVGYLGDTPPPDLHGFRAYARSLEVADVADLVSHAEPLDDGATATFPAGQRHRYDLLVRFPQRLVVVGDAVCSFNPTYGQGMSVAALEAVDLGEVLDATGLQDIGRRCFTRSAATVEAAWELTVGNDLRLQGVVGTRTLLQRCGDRYGRRVGRVAHRDPLVSDAYLRVIGMLAPPTSLLRPTLAVRVLRPGAASAPRRTRSTAPPRQFEPAG
jgi:2-polyprenyl-6-methoxyphenol hydroxylase-like FAD-dependent oxidoreductase